MSTESNISWELLRILTDTLDSYRIRALVDAKEDILDAGIYNEQQYYSILFKIFDQEKLKYNLFRFLNNLENGNIETLEKFSQNHSINFNEVLSILELLKNEKLIHIEEIYNKIEEDDNTDYELNLKDISIKSTKNDISKIKSIYEPVKIIFDSNVCSGCGLCAGICPINCINIDNGYGQIDEDKCIRCGLCYFICPRSFLPVKILKLNQDNSIKSRKQSKIGSYIKAYSARTKVEEIAKVCQDGGITSTCLYYLFDKNEIDFAIGAKMSKELWRPEPILLKNKEDIFLTAGTKYVNNPNLKLLNQMNESNKTTAVIGVPCMMQALLKSEIYDIGVTSLNNIKYRIGIFCMESFSYESLLKIFELLNVDINNVRKTDINKGKFIIYTKDEKELNIPIKEISNLARKDCEVCFDLTSESADISLGSIGSPSGWNTVIIRTETGKKLYNNLISNDLIESKPIDEVKPGLSLLQKIAGVKKNTCINHINTLKKESKRVPYY